VITTKEWQRMLDQAGKTVPLYDLPFSLKQFAWLYLGGPRDLFHVKRR
jgi:hypothetical protein